MGTPRVHGVAVFFDLCGSAGAQITTSVCRIWREGFSLSSGRREQRAMSKVKIDLAYGFSSLSFVDIARSTASVTTLSIFWTMDC